VNPLAPPPRLALLVRAALAERAAARDAWREWLAAEPLASADPLAGRLLPLVYRNLDEHVEESVRLKGAYAAAWYSNQLVVSRTAPALRELAGSGADPIVVGGAALAARWYSDLGARPLRAVDVLVRDIARAPAGVIAYDRPLAGRRTDAATWARAEAAEIGGVPVRVPAADDQLLDVTLLGALWRRGHPLGWIADAAIVVRAAPDLDWERLAARAAACRAALVVRRTLDLLGELGAASVPADAFRALGGARVTRLERAALAGERRGRTTTLRELAHRYEHARAVDPGLGPVAFARLHTGARGAALARRIAASGARRLARLTPSRA
jgi:Uncharacterised nucleotidyltransferase